MDPYRTLGVLRSCTRKEVKDAFLARVPSAHPDHGGEDLTFIQLRAAYEQVLSELDRRARTTPDTNRPSRTPREDGTTTPLDPTKNLDLVLHDEHDQKSAGPVITTDRYIAYFHRVSANAMRGQAERRWKLTRTAGPIFLLYLVFLAPVAGCLSGAATILDLEREAHIAGWTPESVSAMGLLLINLASFLPACLIVWMNDPG
jgi:curved DNA-binding protein CbpA